MMNKDKISIIIPCFNFGEYIGECVNSIVQQTNENSEIIVVNDGSTDNTREILEKLVNRHDNLFVINKENKGVSAARNDGLRVATGKYVMFVDGDDYLANDCLQYMRSLIESCDAEFAFSKNCFTSKNDTQIVEDNIEILNSDQATALLLSPQVIVGSWNKIYKREFLLNNNIRFETDLFYGEGLRFITMVSQLAAKIAVGGRKVYYYRRNNYHSATSQFNVEKLYNGLLSIQRIKDTLISSSPEVREMLVWHETQFHMGIVVRLTSAKKRREMKKLYGNSLCELRKNFLHVCLNSNISLYKRLLLVGTALSPTIMASLDNKRRKFIANQSI